MKQTRQRVVWGVLLLSAAALPAAADTQFRIRRMTRDDVPFGKGQCDIRLQVDGEVEVAVRQDSVSIRTISGREAYDDGSECNQPLPDREIQGFNYEVRDNRGDIRLLAAPSRRNNYTAVVRIRDSAGGQGRYHFRLTWLMTGGSFPSGGRGDDRPGPPEFPRPGGRFTWNNVLHFSSEGRGSSTLTGYGSQRLFAAQVDIERNGRIQASFRTDSGRPVAFSGTLVDRDRDTLKADVAADDRMLRLRGPMYLELDSRQNIYRIRLEATNGRDRLRLEWDRR